MHTRLIAAAIIALVPRVVAAQTTVLHKASSDGRLDAARAVVTNRERFERLWREAHANLSPTPQAPDVDFTRHMVVVAAMGFQPATGRSISIARVRDRDNQLEVTVNVYLRGRYCYGGAAVEYPAVMIRVPLSQSTPVFRDRVTVARCPHPATTPGAER